MSDTNNVKVRVHGRNWQEQTAHDRVQKVLSEATAEAVQDLICDAVEQALDLAHKAHPGGQDIRAWLEPVRALAAEEDPFSTVNQFIGRYLNNSTT
ncbi:hypothetical protein ACH4MG_34905 [Streptomyces sp. NPDC017454]|uniref:hypothetical protein n=1 Tax=Streptomyces sp. NPDC017454 TaxID=3364997 RepID=UPI00379A8CFF